MAVWLNVEFTDVTSPDLSPYRPTCYCRFC